MSNIIYHTSVKNIGPSVEAFGGEMMILFGEGAPDTLKDYCYTIDVNAADQTIVPGQTLAIGGEDFNILYVGEIAQRNLESLGHLTVNFTGKEENLLPGAIVVEARPKPLMEIGTTIAVIG